MTKHIEHLYSCNNLTLKMAAIATETCCEKSVIEVRHKQ